MYMYCSLMLSKVPCHYHDSENHLPRTSSASPIKLNLIEDFSCSNSQEVGYFLWIAFQLYMKLIELFTSPTTILYPSQSASNDRCITVCDGGQMVDKVWTNYNCWFSTICLNGFESCSGLNTFKFFFQALISQLR